MNEHTDSQLLRCYAQDRSEAAFAELVHRHVNFVYSAAHRMVCDPHHAEDVTQGVFVALAKSAGPLAERPVLAGWLHRTAQNIAAQTVRTIERRRAREQEAAAMNALLTADSAADWAHIAPLLDDALGELSDADRDAVLLRYFEKKSAAEMATTLGISAEAAQKRVNRAVERLREFFAKRGVTVGASGLVVVISANAVQAAPVGLAATVSAAAVLAGNAFVTSATATATKTITMTTLQKSLVTFTIAALAGVGIYEAQQAAHLREQLHLWQQQHATLPPPKPPVTAAPAPNAELNALAARNADLSNALAQAKADKARLETENGQAKRSAALFKELAEQATRKNDDPTNAYPTVRHAWVGIGKLGRLAVQSDEDLSKLSPEESKAVEAAQMNSFQEFGTIIKRCSSWSKARPRTSALKRNQTTPQT